MFGVSVRVRFSRSGSKYKGAKKKKKKNKRKKQTEITWLYTMSALIYTLLVPIVLKSPFANLTHTHRDKQSHNIDLWRLCEKSGAEAEWRVPTTTPPQARTHFKIKNVHKCSHRCNISCRHPQPPSRLDNLSRSFLLSHTQTDTHPNLSSVSVIRYWFKAALDITSISAFLHRLWYFSTFYGICPGRQTHAFWDMGYLALPGQKWDFFL